MIVRSSEAKWEGDLRTGKGLVKLANSAIEIDYSFESRFATGIGTNPEELIGAAHAGCYSMALSAGLTKLGHPPRRIHTIAKVHLDRKGDQFSISEIELRTEAVVPGIDQATLEREAETAKANCPVSKALAGTNIILRSVLLVLGGEQKTANA